MSPEPQKKLPPQYDTEQDIIDAINLYIDYLECWKKSLKGGPHPGAESCYHTYCKDFDERFPV